eukprot:c23399_g1_i1 orf=388-2739(-)
MAHRDSSREYLDILTESGELTGIAKQRCLVHTDGDYHRVVNVWIYVESTRELLLQRRSDSMDSWPGLWDVSCAGHICAGDTSLISARRELQEELGVTLPSRAFELLFVCLQKSVTSDGKLLNEYCDVYLVTILTQIPLEAFTLQESEVSMVKYINWKDYEGLLRKGDLACVPYDVNGEYGQLFMAIQKRYESDITVRQLSLQNKLRRYVPVELTEKLTELSEGDIIALSYTIQAAQVLDEIFLQQVWSTNPALKIWLEQHGEDSELDKLKLSYFLINKCPWSSLDENKAYLTTADSIAEVAQEAVKPVSGWEGIQYRAAFPVQKPPGDNFYPVDMTRMEFELWKGTLNQEEQAAATGFFSVIRRPDEGLLNCTPLSDAQIEQQPLHETSKVSNLQIVPYSKEYNELLTRAAQYLRKAGDASDTPSLKKLLGAKADSFLSDNYYESDVAWIELNSAVDVTIGPYETYEDTLFGYKATFEAFIGVRDEVATSQVKLFSNHLQELENNLPLDNKYKSKSVTASPIRVIRLVYNAGDVKGPQTVAFNLPNDDKIVKAHGSAMVLLKNVSEAKFIHILQPIARVCISKSQQEDVDFESFFTHTICHECCHGIGPHTIILPNGKESTVRLELQELYSAIEEAKADIVGLWALHYLLDQGLLAEQLEKTMYVSFLAGCFRSIRFGLNEAHGKGQALQFNWILERGGFIAHSDGTFSVDFSKVREAVETLSKEIMTIQAQGDKVAAKSLLDKYASITQPLQQALDSLQDVEVPVDIFPSFGVVNQLAALAL